MFYGYIQFLLLLKLVPSKVNSEMFKCVFRPLNKLRRMNSHIYATR